MIDACRPSAVTLTITLFVLGNVLFFLLTAEGGAPSAPVRAEDVYLTVLIDVDANAALLPHHFHHYSMAGVRPQNMLIALDSGSNDMRALERWTRFYAMRNVTVERFPFEYTSCTMLQWTNDALRRRGVVHPHQWTISTDVDEFTRFPSGDAIAFVRRLAEEGATHAFGFLNDRVAMDGRLITVNQETCIWRQFPLQCSITSRLIGGTTQKVVAYRGDQRASTGHHYMVWNTILRAKCSLVPKFHVPIPHSLPSAWRGAPLAVDHYKWDEVALVKLRRRSRSKSGNAGESASVLRSLLENHNKICVDCPELSCVLAEEIDSYCQRADGLRGGDGE
jgi:hypothetical protein